MFMFYVYFMVCSGIKVSFIAISETQKDDQRAAEALKEYMISPEKAAAEAPAAV